MGCTQSVSQDIHSPRMFPKNPHKIPQSSNGNQEGNSSLLQTDSVLKTIFTTNKGPHQNSSFNNSFQNSDGYIQDLYQKCSGNLQQFFYKLQQEVSSIYIQISKSTLEQMNQNTLINNQSKIQISEQILAFNLNILKVIGKKTNHKFDQHLFKQVNKLQKNLVGYLKMKYPRGGQTFVPGDLMKVFKEFDISQNVEFDILRNSNTYFGDQSDQNLSKSIKIFLNKIIDQLDWHYGRFQKMMQEQVFCIKDQNGQSKTLNYKIGRKIPQNIAKYVQLDSSNLEITSPQIFRVLIKWMTDLEQVLLNPTQKINTKKNFKCFIEEDQKGQKIFDQINEDEYHDLINYELIQKIETEKGSYQGNMKVLLNDMDRFNFNLIKLLDISVRKQKYVPVKQMQIIKYSNLNAKFISWILAQKLMLVMIKLIKIGKSFYNSKNMVTLDLINFKVSDLMRCQVSGNKKQILQVYNNLKRLQVEGSIKIIKIKNRLATSLNDAMIIFSLKNTFLICQIQLLLTDSSQKINQKYKNIETLNHFFYQLQRSPYGILSQIAVLLAYKDSKVSYQDNINFLPNQIHIKKCEKQHNDKVFEKKIQLKPFICTKCTNYYEKLHNIFIMKQCQQCNIFICGKCLLSDNQALQNFIVHKQMSEILQLKINKTLSLLRNIEKSIRARDILALFQQPFEKIAKIFGSTEVSSSKLMQYLTKKHNSNQNTHPYFVLINFKTGKADFKLLEYKFGSKQIINPFSHTVSYNDKQKISCTSYDLILLFKKQIKFQYANDFLDSLLYVFANEYFLRKQLRNQTITCIKLQDILIPIQFIPKIQEKSEQVNWKIQKTFPDQTLNEYVSTLPDLEGAKSILKFNDLGLFSKHMNYFKQIDWTNQIKQLKLGKNNINDISIVIQYCKNLQKLYVNNNQLVKITFTQPLDQLQILNCSQNKISSLQNIKFIKNVNKLLAQNNAIEKFEQNQFLNLKILNLSTNSLSSIKQICDSSIPNLQQLNLQSDQYNIGYGQSIFNFPKLKSLICTYPCKKITITSTKIQRLYYSKSGLQEISIASIQNLKFANLHSNNLNSMNFLFPQSTNNTNNTIIEIDLARNSISSVPLIKSKTLKTLNLSSNQITSMTNLTNSMMTQIQLIDLKQNQISKLSYLNFKSLSILDLAYNPLTSFFQLENSTLDSLKQLLLSHTEIIESFPKLSLKSLRKLQIFSVTFTNIDNLAKCNFPEIQQIFLKACEINQFPLLNFDSLVILDLQGSQIKQLKNIQGSTLKNLQTLNLTTIYVADQEPVNQMLVPDEVRQQAVTKQKIFTCKLNFPKLRLLNFDYSNIKVLTGLQNSQLQKIQELSIRGLKLTHYPLLNLSNLIKINAESCNITNFSQLMNAQLTNIQQVNLAYNLIENIQNLTFSKLKVLKLNGNQLKSYNQAGQTPCLQNLDLSSNKLQVFPILKCGKLKVLQVGLNQFKDISNLQFCQLLKLETLRLENYDFSQIKFPKVSMESLKSLYFRTNNIKDISNFQFSNLPLVQDINFSLNAIQNVPKIKFPNLKFLRLNQNSINDITKLSQSEMPQLQIIQLEQNKVSVLPYLPFPNLIKIFMHKNDVTDVSGFNQSPIKNFLILNVCQSKDLKDFPILKNTFEELYANDTNLTDAFQVNNYKNLKKIQINRNKILSVPAFKQKLLVMIQLQGNLITDLSQFASEQYPLVTQFSVKGNPLKKMPKIRMPSLLGAYLNDCQFQDITQFEKSDLPSMNMLSFQNNKIKHCKSLPFANLKSIYFSRNPLQEVVFLTLPQYPKLQMLVFATTNIKKVQVLPKLPQLSKVWFNSSKIESIQWLAMSAKNLPKMGSMIILDNNVQTLPNLSNFKSQLTLNLKNNPVKNISAFLQTKDSVVSLTTSLCYQSDKQYAQAYQKIIKVCQYPSISKYIPK